MSSSLPGLRRTILAFLAFVLGILWTTHVALACTNILVGSEATTDGSTYVTYSCDGGVYAAIRVEPAATYGEGSIIDLFEEPGWEDASSEPSAHIGSIPQVTNTHRYIDMLAGPMYAHIGGMNEHGVSIAETTLYGVRDQLTNPRGWMTPFAADKNRSLMALALQRATTAREAVQVIGELAETYGYHSTYPMDGEHLAIGDGNDVWSMEIFGPGPFWQPGSDEPGTVWCAQRVPDGHVGISANRSRIGEIDLEDNDHFMASPNVYSLAERMGWWSADSGEPFIWHEVYAPSDLWRAVIREWRVLSLVAPSLELDIDDGRFPFSVEPDEPLDTLAVSSLQRDMLEGTPFEPTGEPAFLVDGEPSPLACPACSPLFYELVGVDRQRSVNNPYSSFSCLYQANASWPDAAQGCAWFGFGPAATTCYVPLYTGITHLPAVWGETSLELFDADIPFWATQLPGRLATAEWLSAYADIQDVRDPAEEQFRAEQESVLTTASSLEAFDAAAWLNEYTQARMDAVMEGFRELANYMLTAYYVFNVPLDAASLPAIHIEE